MGLRRVILLAACLALPALSAWSAWPQAREPARPTQVRPAQRTLQIQHQGWQYNEKDETSEFKKAIVTDEDTVFRADTVRVNSRKGVQTAEAAGSLAMTDPEVDVTGEKAVIQYAKAKRLAVLTGGVHILVKPKPDATPPPTGPAPVAVQEGRATVQTPPGDEEDENNARAARKNPAEITCDRLEYSYDKKKKHAKLTGSFKVVQKLSDRTRTLTADHAEWFGLEDRVVLYAPVHWEDTKGMKGDSPADVVVFTKEGSEGIQMQKGTVTLPVEDEEEGE